MTNFPQSGHVQACRKRPKCITGTDFSAPNHHGGPQQWSRWVRTKSIILKPFSDMMCTIQSFLPVFLSFSPYKMSQPQKWLVIAHFLVYNSEKKNCGLLIPTVAKICRCDLRIYPQKCFGLKSRIRYVFRVLDVCSHQAAFKALIPVN